MTSTDIPSSCEDQGPSEITRLLIKALKALHAHGEGDFACRIAAEAWAAMRGTHPSDAEKLNAALHFLVRSNEPKTH